MAIEGIIIQQYNTTLEIAGVPVASIQEFTLPKIEVEASTHSEGRYDGKRPGRVTVADIEIQKLLVFGEPLNNWAWIWLKTVANLNGLSLPPAGYLRNGRILTRDNNGIVTNIYQFENAWVKAIDQGTHSLTASDNAMETVTLSVDKYYEVTVVG